MHLKFNNCFCPLQNLSFDLGDAAKWEYMFVNTDKPLLALPSVNDDPLEVDDDEVCFDTHFNCHLTIKNLLKNVVL